MDVSFTPQISSRSLKLSNDIGVNRLTSVEQFEFIRTHGTLTYDDFFHDFLLPNKPCVLSPVVTENWRSRREWVKENKTPDVEYLRKHFGTYMTANPTWRTVETVILYLGTFIS